MKRRTNSSPAAKLSEQFHGRPVRKVRDYVEVSQERTELADLGKLVELQILEGKHVRVLQFSDDVRVAATADGGQLYFVGGDQAIDLSALHLDKHLPKDHVTLGPVAAIAYHTSKAFHDFEPSVYEHRFGEDGGSLPLLHYDVLNRRLYLTGGSYQVRPEGIVN